MMACDRCKKRTQRYLHQQIGTPTTYYCCVCNGCADFTGLDELEREVGAYQMCEAARR